MGKLGLAAAFLGAPALAVIVWLTLNMVRHVDTGQQLQQVKHELRQEHFDQQFDQAWTGMGLGPKGEQPTKSARVVDLEQQRDALEATAKAERDKQGETIEEMEDAVRQSSAANQAEIDKLVSKEQSK